MIRYIKRYRDTGRTNVIDKKVELIARSKNGEVFPMELTVKEIGSNRQTSAFVAYLRDITEDLMRRSNAVLFSAIESVMPDPLIVITETGTIQAFTPAACQLFGYTKDEVLGENVKMLMPSDVAALHDDYLRNYVLTGVKHAVDTTRRVVAKRKNGTTVDVELRVREVQDVSFGRCFIAYVKDCSNEYDFAIETEVGEGMIELNPDAIIMINHKGVVTKFNQKAEEMFEFDRKHIIGRNVRVLMPENFASRHDQYLATYAQTGIKHVVDSERLVTGEKKNGEQFKVSLRIREVKEGDKVFFIGYLRPPPK